jgi:DNA polymerase III sliding clamp (beta) subunit (PCNA family)
MRIKNNNLKAFKRMFKFCDKYSPQKYLNGVLIDSEFGNMVFVASNGHYIVKYITDIKFSTDNPLLVDVDFGSIVKTTKNDFVDVNNDDIEFSKDGFIITGQYMEDVFPDHKKMMTIEKGAIEESSLPFEINFKYLSDFLEFNNNTLYGVSVFDNDKSILLKHRSFEALIMKTNKR